MKQSHIKSALKNGYITKENNSGVEVLVALGGGGGVEVGVGGGGAEEATLKGKNLLL